VAKFERGDMRKAATKTKRARAALLNRLRNESLRVAARHLRINIVETPALAALAIASLAQSGVECIWHEGIKFPVRYGWARVICCPETGWALLSVSGGWLV
jgi:hypothetical protein